MRYFMTSLLVGVGGWLVLAAVAPINAFSLTPSSQAYPTYLAPYYDMYLGGAKDNASELTDLLYGYLLPRGMDRFKAYLAIKRLEELPAEQSKVAIPYLVALIGSAYEPCSESEGGFQPSGAGQIQNEKYPADEAVIAFGKRATPDILNIFNMPRPIETPGLAFRSYQHLVDVLVSIEGPNEAEKLLREKLTSFTDEDFRSRVVTAIALLRARKDVPRDAETPQDKFEQELKRVKEELASEKPPETQPAQPGAEPPAAITPAPPEAHKPFPWYYIVIAAAVLALTLALILTLTRKK